jgi:hypothetical protein
VIERVEGETPHGGAYAVLFYSDDRGRSVPKERATRVAITEYDSTDRLIFETFGTIRPDADGAP